eukprot:scaffold6.g2651.t1
MDVSEKDAARSKWRLTQRHSRRGRGDGRAGGRGRGRVAQAAVDLGSNVTRYHDSEPQLDEGGAAAGAAPGGPAPRSRGADLAELLARADAFDPQFYYRCRASLADEADPPPPGPASSGFQARAAMRRRPWLPLGVSLDIQGLATCLALLPRNAVLNTDAFSEDEEEVEGAEDKEAEEEQQRDGKKREAQQPRQHQLNWQQGHSERQKAWTTS